MNVLFICTANVCRSPLAEGYLKYLLNQSSGTGITVSSAGVIALKGSPAFDCVSEVARMHGFDLAGHRATQLTLERARQADEILCMETWHASKVADLDPELIQKIVLLGSYHPKQNRLMQIPDPRNFDVPCTLDVFQIIQPSVDRFMQKLLR